MKFICIRFEHGQEVFFNLDQLERIEVVVPVNLERITHANVRFKGHEIFRVHFDSYRLKDLKDLLSGSINILSLKEERCPTDEEIIDSVLNKNGKH